MSRMNTDYTSLRLPLCTHHNDHYDVLYLIPKGLTLFSEKDNDFIVLALNILKNNTLHSSIHIAKQHVDSALFEEGALYSFIENILHPHIQSLQSLHHRLFYTYHDTETHEHAPYALPYRLRLQHNRIIMTAEPSRRVVLLSEEEPFFCDITDASYEDFFKALFALHGFPKETVTPFDAMSHHSQSLFDTHYSYLAELQKHLIGLLYIKSIILSCLKKA